MNPAAALIAVALPLVTFAFGWALVGMAADLDNEERFAAAWGAGFGFLGLTEFIAFLTHAPPGLFHICILALMVAGALVLRFMSPRNKPLATDFWWLAGLWALGVAHLVAVQALLPIYVGGDWWGDWSMHYQAAQVFLGTRSDDWAFMGQFTMASRTPLFNLVAAFGLSLAGEQFWVFQIVASWMNWCFPLALYLIVRDFAGARVGRFALLLAPLNVWMLHMAWFTWPKLLAAYFLLLGLHFYLTAFRLRRADPTAARRRFLLFWVSSLLGILSHSVGIVYLLPLLLHALVIGRRERRLTLRLSDLGALALSAALVLGPWHAWLFGRYGPDKIREASPVTAMKAQLAENWSNVGLAWLLAVGQNVVTSVLPGPDQTTRDASNVPTALYLYATGFYFNSLTGALTLTLTAFLGLRMVWSRRGAAPSVPSPPDAAPDRTAVWLFAGLGCMGSVVLHPALSIHGLAHNAFFTSAVLLVGFAWASLARTPRAWVLAMVAGMVFEFLMLFWSHIWFAADPELLDKLAINLSAKQEEGYVFLHDLLGEGKSWAVATTGILQAVLVVLILSATLRRPAERPSPP